MKQFKWWVIPSVLIVVYLFRDLDTSRGFGYILSKRLLRVGAMIICAYTTTTATVYFQTLSHNALITPSVLGIDALYLFVQTIIVFALGHYLSFGLQFIITLVILVGVSSTLYGWLLERMQSDTLRLILIGILGSSVLQSVIESFKMMVSPNDYAIIQSYALASFRDVSLAKLGVSLLVLLPCMLLKKHLDKTLDCVGLGDSWAHNYGIDVNRFKKHSLLLVCGLSGLTTALMGPNLFLGLIVVTITKRLQNHYSHPDLIRNGWAVALALICGAQYLFESVLHLQGSIALVLTLLGGVMYGLLLTRKERL